MEISINKKIGNDVMQIKIENQDIKKALATALAFTEKDVCGNCGKTDIVWRTNKAKSEKGEFTYVKRVCLDCTSTSTLGEYQPAGSGYFWKKWEIYKKNEKQPSSVEDIEF